MHFQILAKVLHLQDAIGAGCALIAGIDLVSVKVSRAKALEAIGRQPECKGDVTSTMLLAVPLQRQLAYGFVRSVADLCSAWHAHEFPGIMSAE